MKRTCAVLQWTIRATCLTTLLVGLMGCSVREDLSAGLMTRMSDLPLAASQRAGAEPDLPIAPRTKRQASIDGFASDPFPLQASPNSVQDESQVRPLFADVGSPLPTTQGTGANRSHALPPENPAPTPIAAHEGPLTSYDIFKQRLYQTTGTKYILSLDFVDQQIIDAPSKGYNRGVARFDLGIDQDLWKGATFSMDARGGVGTGIDPLIPNFVNTNQYETVPPIFILRLAFYQSFLNERVILRVGKFDVGDFIDYNRFGYYNFLAFSFAHNTVIPLPGNTLGALVRVKPVDWLILQGGFSNMDQAPTEAGFTSFGNRDYLQIYEAAYVTKFFGQDGTYRFLGWYDNRTLARPDGGGLEAGRGGVGVSFDQNITKMFGLFARYGYSDQHIVDVVQHWSAGFLWTGPIQARPKDTLGLGVLQNYYGAAHRARVRTNAADVETLLETYYQYELNPYTSVVPTFQYVGNPNGTHRKGEFIAALHVNVHL